MWFFHGIISRESFLSLIIIPWRSIYICIHLHIYMTPLVLSDEPRSFCFLMPSGIFGEFDPTSVGKSWSFELEAGSTTV